VVIPHYLTRFCCTSFSRLWELGGHTLSLRVRDDRDHGFQMIVIIHSRAA
jgi:hypothetical protein